MFIDIDARRSCALLLALLLAACGNGKDGTATDSEAQSTGPSATDTTVASATDTTVASATDTTVASATDTTVASATDPGPTTSAATEADTEAPAAGCECAAPAACSVALCPTVAYDEDIADSGGPDTDGEAELEAALSCALTALRDGKAGRIDWTYTAGSGQIDEYGSFALFGDGSARRSFGGIEDLCEYLSDDVGVGPLRDAKSYEDCLAEPAASTRFGCVRGAVPATLVVCQEGELDCSGF
jgi:hypothetical protein